MISVSGAVSTIRAPPRTSGCTPDVLLQPA
jgi:hypothetical protein